MDAVTDTVPPRPEPRGHRCARTARNRRSGARPRPGGCTARRTGAWSAAWPKGWPGIWASRCGSCGSRSCCWRSAAARGSRRTRRSGRWCRSRPTGTGRTVRRRSGQLAGPSPADPARSSGASSATPDEQSSRVGPLLALGAVALGGSAARPAGRARAVRTGRGAASRRRAGRRGALAGRRRPAARTLAADRHRRGHRAARLGAGRHRRGVRPRRRSPRCSARAAGCRPRWTGWPARSSSSAGVALVAGPWLVRNARELREERRERIRSQERAELAAHVHDSVVQTLTLIQRNADDPREVARLARAEERALRQWLYRPEGTRAADRSSAALGGGRRRGRGRARRRGRGRGRSATRTVDERLGALLQAATRGDGQRGQVRRRAAGPVSVYAEVDAGAGVGVRPRPRPGLRPRRGAGGPARASGSRSSAGWSGTAAAPRSSPRPARAPRCGCRCRAPPVAAPQRPREPQQTRTTRRND